MTVLSSHPRTRIRAARPGVVLMVLAVALSSMAVACSDITEPRSEAEVEPSALDQEVTMPIAAVVTTVLQPGAEPREALRRSFAVGNTQQVTLHTDHHIEQQLNNQPAHDFSPPAITIPLTARTGSDGVDLTLGSATSSNPDLAQQLQSADGSHAGFAMSDVGAITALRMTPTPSTSEAARSALEQAFYQAVYQSIAFPADPVGEGAVWTVHQRVSADVPLNQVTTATLTRREGNLLTIALDVTQTPTSKVWDLPSNAGTLDIVDYVMHGAGTITVDLVLPLPVSGSITVGGSQSYRDPKSAVLLCQKTSTRVQWDR
ncbi:hypothetical protein ABIA39_000971 [Nocardia sp. GAS34]|uniref:hypothetical protein n=1 Tax=unclassified Nocardia TaxID=2637762 RepID=UPI003D200E8A